MKSDDQLKFAAECFALTARLMREAMRSNGGPAVASLALARALCAFMVREGKKEVTREQLRFELLEMVGDVFDQTFEVQR